jgi:hypothetical protein
MNNVVRELVTLLTVEADDASMSRAEASIDSMIGGITASLAGIGTIFGSSMAVLGPVVSKGWEFAKSIEMSKAQMTSMLGDMEKASSLMDQITNFAIETPFNVQQVAQSANQMMQYGVEAERIIPTLKMLGDVAGADMDRFKGLAFAFGQIKGLGRLQGQDRNQLINWGFNPMREMAKMIEEGLFEDAVLKSIQRASKSFRGMEFGEFKTFISNTDNAMKVLNEAMLRNAISFDMVEAAFEHATSAGGMFYGNLERQNQTMQGQINQTEETIAKLGASVVDKLFPVFKEILGNIQNINLEWAGGFAKMAVDFLQVVGAGETFSKVLEGIISGMLYLWGAATTMLGGLMALLGVLRKILDMLSVALSHIIPNVDIFTYAIQVATSAVLGLSAAFAVLGMRALVGQLTAIANGMIAVAGTTTIASAAVSKLAIAFKLLGKATIILAVIQMAFSLLSPILERLLGIDLGTQTKNESDAVAKAWEEQKQGNAARALQKVNIDNTENITINAPKDKDGKTRMTPRTMAESLAMARGRTAMSIQKLFIEAVPSG